MRQPTFLILGAAKCGTTALASFIASHPDVFITNPKEPHFFDGNYEIGIDDYLEKYYSGWTNEKAAGEATPTYLSVPCVAERIRKSFPDIKLIATLRNPVERAYSSWWMLYARGMEKLSFENAISSELEKSINIDSAGSIYTEEIARQSTARIKAGKEICFREYLFAGQYADHLERYYENFPKHNIKVILSSQLRKNHTQTIREIWDFIGVDTSHPAPDSNAVNEALGIKAVPILKSIKALGLMPARHIIPSDIRSYIKNLLSNMGERPEISIETKQLLLEYFTPHIKKLETLINKDLSDWLK
jgi:hypothetical protein